MMKHFYAAHSSMGLNFTYDSPCWFVYAFNSAQERDTWLAKNQYDGQKYVAKAVERSEAIKIAPELKSKSADGYGQDAPHRVVHL